MSIFGSNTNSSNPFGSGTSSIFGQSSQANQQSSNSFFNAGTTNSASQLQPKSLFGTLSQPAPQPATQSGGIFGQSQPQQSGGLFGPSQPQQSNNLFGNTQSSTAAPQGSSLFGKSQPSAQSGLFAPQQQSQPSIFNPNVTQQQQQQPSIPQASLFGQQPSLFKQTEVWPRPRTVADQIEVAFQKWNPDSQISLFQTYIYNFTDPKFVPFCQPGPSDNPSKWEEAISKKPYPGAVPVMVKGFDQLGKRMLLQSQLLKVLQGRLHEINNGLSEMLRRHDLEISVRAAEARKRHSRLNLQCMRLATKVQVLRNRGYAMGSAEEELKDKLLKLEQKVMDPRLNGRGEEIWARMVSVRERGRVLQDEIEKAGGKAIPQKTEAGIDEEVMKKARKILEDYSSQLTHLTKELAQLQKDYREWEDGKSGTTSGVGQR